MTKLDKDALTCIEAKIIDLSRQVKSIVFDIDEVVNRSRSYDAQCTLLRSSDYANRAFGLLESAKIVIQKYYTTTTMEEKK